MFLHLSVIHSVHRGWCYDVTVVDPGGAEGAMAPSPVQISHKKDGRLYIDFMFLGPLPSRWIRCCVTSCYGHHFP